MTTPAAVSHTQQTDVRYYSRFTLAQRYLHAVVMVTFLGLAATGLTLRFSESPWSIGFAKAIGGYSAILFFHKLSALGLTVVFVMHVANVLYRVAAKREYGLIWGPDSLVPNLKDFRDFFGNLRWFLWLGPKPKIDRYAYWEKVDYWAVFWGMGIIGLSGYALWFAPFFAKLIPGSWMSIALLIHGEEALLAVGFIFTIHFFNEHLRPDNFPMDLTIFTGRQTEAEFAERHPEEYQRKLELGKLESLRLPPPERWLINMSRLIGVTVVVIGFVILAYTIRAFLKS
ncbi:MAG TPA: cytochrome b/b6 domain-containing protein [Bryobacteraceae bacterium]|nr:cytochrome b/b6 domain-containing protein [Bryobacteraceae bacterium]